MQRTKKILIPLLLGAALFSHSLAAQNNFSGFNYQAVVRDASGDPLPNQNVGVQFVLSCGSLQPYVEDHSVTTDANGLMDLVIGEGSPQFGSAPFNTIDWSGCGTWTWNVTVSMDITGGTNYSLVGSQQMKAVPFALHALSSDNGGSTPQNLTLSNDTLYITGGNNVYLGNGSDDDWVLSGDTLHSDGRRVGIGTGSPDTTLHVVGKLKYQDGTQGAQKILASDADGNASWDNLSAEVIFGSGNVPEGNLSCLSLSGSLGLGTLPAAMAVSGIYAYVVDGGTDDLKVIDISDAFAPVLVGSLGIGPNPISVAVAGNYAYVVDSGSDDLKVIDISNPTSPSLSGSEPIGTHATSLAVSGNYAYVVDNQTNDLRVIDISDPSNPSFSGSLGIGNAPWSVAVSESHAYVVGQSTGDLQAIDISDPSAPVLSGSLGLGSTPSFVAVSGNYAYVVDLQSDDLKVIDISDPSNPTLSGSLGIGPLPRSVAVSGNYAYVVDNGTDDLKAIDISDPASPSLLGTLGLGSLPNSVVVSGNYAYVVDLGSTDLKAINLFCQSAITLDPGTGEFNAQPLAWELNGSDLVNANSGNVGIGTSNPTTMLDVNGGVHTKFSGSTVFTITPGDAWYNFTVPAVPANMGWVDNALVLASISDGCNARVTTARMTSTTNMSVRIVNECGGTGPTRLNYIIFKL